MLELNPEVPQGPLVDFPRFHQGVQIGQGLLQHRGPQPLGEEQPPVAQLGGVQKLLHVQLVPVLGGAEDAAFPQHVVLLGIQQQRGLAVDFL